MDDGEKTGDKKTQKPGEPGNQGQALVYRRVSRAPKLNG